MYELVELIRGALGTKGKHFQPNQHDESSQETRFGRETSPPPYLENNDMKKLVETIEQMQKRLTAIERGHRVNLKGSYPPTVTTRDIKTFDDIHVTLTEEDFYPLLEIPNDPESVVVLMKWLQYLVDKVGKNHLPDILSYYVDIGWISDDVRLDLIKYSKGITEEHPGQSPPPQSPNLPTKDHIQSLLYIQKLKGIYLDDRFVCRIEREMEKLTKSLENNKFQ